MTVSFDAFRETFLAEIRVGVLRTKLSALDLEAAAVAVKYGLVTPEQAMGELHARDALQWLHLGGGPDHE